ncbi:MAG: TonB-dependent receptor [bacterium]|nr:TonB-dependent receptor [bacterium]
MIIKKNKGFTIAIAMIFMLIIPGVRWDLHANGNSKRTGTISGTLTDMDTRQPLQGADVILVGTKRITVSNMEGKFIFTDVPVGSYSLKFSLPGIQPRVRTDIIVKSKRTVTVNAVMPLITLESKSVTVTAGFFARTPDQPANTVSFSNEEIRRAPGAAGDVSRIISSLPSIAQVSDQVNNLVVRGGSPHENLFLVDNIPVPNINHFPFQGTAGGAVSLLNVDFIEDVEFFAGGFSAIYGDRLSSVMNLRLREGSRKDFNGQLTLDFSGAGISLEGPLPGKKEGEARGSWMFSLRRSYLDLLTEMMDAGAAVQYSDIQGKMVYDLSDRSKLTVLGVLGIDKSKVTREDAADLGESLFGVSRNREHTVGINWFRMWNDKVYSDTSVSHTFTRFDYDFNKTATDTLSLENVSEEESWHIRSVTHLNLNHAHKLRFGFEGKHGTSKYNYFAAAYTDALGQEVPQVYKQINEDAWKSSLFAEYTVNPFSRLSFNLGVRADYFSYTGRTSVSPRGSVTLKLSDRTSVSAAAGIFRQNLPLLLLYRNEKNKDLREPSAFQYSIGLNHLFGESVRLSIEAYHKSYRNFPVDPQRGSLCILDDLFGFSLFGDGALSDAGKARSYGVEFVLQKKLKEKFYGMVSGSWFRTQYRDLAGVWRNRVFDNQCIFALQGGYKPNRKWEFSVRWLIAGGMPYTPFDIAASERANSGIFDTSQINGKRMPAYHSLNVRLDRRFHFSGSNLTTYLSVWNAYNNKNTASYHWNEIENKPDYTYQFSLLPIIGIEYEF